MSYPPENNIPAFCRHRVDPVATESGNIIFLETWTSQRKLGWLRYALRMGEGGPEAGALGAGRSGWAGAHGCPRRRPVCGPFPRLGFAARGRCGPSRETRQGSRVAPWDSRRGRALDCAQGTTCAGHLARRRAGGGRDASWRMRVAAVIVWFPMRGGPFMGGSRPARRRSEGGRGGGGGLRLVAVAGCGAASRPVGSASAHAASPGSLAGLSLSNVVG
jgi:hypothetical protein